MYTYQVVLALVGIILLAKRGLVASGSVAINVNEQKTFEVPAGGKLLNALADEKIFLSSACGGGGTCAQCHVHVLELPRTTGALAVAQASAQPSQSSVVHEHVHDSS